jgi:hypothetical protein
MSVTKYNISPENQQLFEEAKARYPADKEKYGEDIARTIAKTERYSDI